MEDPEKDKIILTYKDSDLWRSDLGILNGPHFLNDRIIDFSFTLIAARHPSPTTLLVSSAVSFWAANCSDHASLTAVLGPLDFPARTLLLFPVNNNDDVSRAEGGTHWSLLVFDRTASVFSHYDSCSGANRAHASRLYSALVGFVGDPTVRFLEPDGSPQQTNGYDCGLYVIAFAEALCRRKDGAGGDRLGLGFGDLAAEVNPGLISALRLGILETAAELINKGYTGEE